MQSQRDTYVASRGCLGLVFAADFCQFKFSIQLANNTLAFRIYSSLQVVSPEIGYVYSK